MDLEVQSMSYEFTVDAGLVIFSRDGRAQFGWHNRETGAFHAEADGRCIPDAVGAVEFHSDVMH
ncbi:hypothetical protein [Caballeronia arvi]|nr:hypothetical protein [Caballeronia arvi]